MLEADSWAGASDSFVHEPAPPLHSINVLELPTEMLLAVLEWLLRVGPVVLLGAVSRVCMRMRAVCGVRKVNWSRAKGALMLAVRHWYH